MRSDKDPSLGRRRICSPVQEVGSRTVQMAEKSIRSKASFLAAIYLADAGIRYRTADSDQAYKPGKNLLEKVIEITENTRLSSTLLV